MWEKPVGLGLPIFPGEFWSHGWTNVPEISFAEVAWHSAFYKFRSCALCHKCQVLNSLEKYHYCHLFLGSTLSVITKYSWLQRVGWKFKMWQLAVFDSCYFVAMEQWSLCRTVYSSPFFVSISFFCLPSVMNPTSRLLNNFFAAMYCLFFAVRTDMGFWRDTIPLSF